MDRWFGKSAIVLGAGSNIGVAISEMLVQYGMRVVGLARNPALVKEAIQRLEGAPGRLELREIDETVEEDILQAFRWTTEKFGPVHVLVNSAAMSRDPTKTIGVAEVWKNVLDTNVLGLSVATKEAISSMMSHGVKGHIVHVNSVAGGDTVFNAGMYTASKFAVNTLAEQLRITLAREGTKIKVTSIHSGILDVDLINPDAYSSMETDTKISPKLNPEDIVNAVLYALASPQRVQINEIVIRALGTETY